LTSELQVLKEKSDAVIVAPDQPSSDPIQDKDLVLKPIEQSQQDDTVVAEQRPPGPESSADASEQLSYMDAQFDKIVAEAESLPGSTG
jgi:hypothetical protein